MNKMVKKMNVRIDSTNSGLSLQMSAQSYKFSINPKNGGTIVKSMEQANNCRVKPTNVGLMVQMYNQPEVCRVDGEKVVVREEEREGMLEHSKRKRCKRMPYDKKDVEVKGKKVTEENVKRNIQEDVFKFLKRYVDFHRCP